VKFPQNNFFLRVVSALALLPVLLFCLWKGGLWSTVLFSLAAALCMLEYLSIAWGRPGLWGVAAALLVALAPWLFSFSLGNPLAWVLLICRYESSCFQAFQSPLSWVLLIWGILYMGGWAWHLCLGPREEAAARMGHLMAASVYIGLGIAALSALRQQGFAWVFMALVLTWANDTFAYFVGRWKGKHKMLPSVSPGKTWEGFGGGMLGSIAGACILKLWVFVEMPWWGCLLLGVAAGLLGPLGDLSESALKRSFGKKDSGKLLPGHGGILDRVDALLLIAPAVWLYAVLFPMAA